MASKAAIVRCIACSCADRPMRYRHRLHQPFHYFDPKLPNADPSRSAWATAPGSGGRLHGLARSTGRSWCRKPAGARHATVASACRAAVSSAARSSRPVCECILTSTLRCGTVLSDYSLVTYQPNQGGKGPADPGPTILRIVLSRTTVTPPDHERSRIRTRWLSVASP